MSSISILNNELNYLFHDVTGLHFSNAVAMTIGPQHIQTDVEIRMPEAALWNGIFPLFKQDFLSKETEHSVSWSSWEMSGPPAFPEQTPRLRQFRTNKKSQNSVRPNDAGCVSSVNLTEVGNNGVKQTVPSPKQQGCMSVQLCQKPRLIGKRRSFD
jgi:hypothetical protein